MTFSVTKIRKEWQERRGVALALAIVLAAVVLLFGFASNSFRVAKFVEWPFGCDGFGYLRQAQLFRDNGWIGGLDTRIDDDRSTYLIDKMRAIGAPTQMWAHGIAPHCHHYKDRTQRIVLQYPPGVGFFLSFFTESVQAHWAFVSYNFLVLAIVVATGVAARSVVVPFLAVTLGVFLFRGIYQFVPDLSITPSAVTALMAGALTVAATGMTALGRRMIFLALLGFVIGVSTALRVPNLFWLFGPGAVLGANFLGRPSRRTFAEPAALGLGALVGLIPVLAANAINAGHPLATTYSIGDAKPPQFEWDVLVGGLRYYFLERGSASAFTLVAAGFVVGVLAFRRRLRGAGIGPAAAMGALSLAFTLAYMVLHTPRVGYYLFPTSAYAMTIAVLCLVRSENARVEAVDAPAPAVRFAVLAATLALALGLTRFITMAVSPDYTKPNVTAAFPPQAVVWADLMTGPINYFLHRQAAVLPFLEPSLRRPVIEAIAGDGVPQFVVVEPGHMEEEVARLREWAEAEPAGQAFGYQVYRLDLPALAHSSTDSAPR